MKRFKVSAFALFVGIICLGNTGLIRVAADNIIPISPEALSRPGFTATNKGIKYLKPDGDFLHDSWLFIGSQGWCFDSDGMMVTGKRIIDDRVWFLTYEGVFILLEDKGAKASAASVPATVKTQSATDSSGAKAPSAAAAPAAAKTPEGAKAPSQSSASPALNNVGDMSQLLGKPVSEAKASLNSKGLAAVTVEGDTSGNVNYIGAGFGNEPDFELYGMKKGMTLPQLESALESQGFKYLGWDLNEGASDWIFQKDNILVGVDAFGVHAEDMPVNSYEPGDVYAMYYGVYAVDCIDGTDGDGKDAFRYRTKDNPGVW